MTTPMMKINLTLSPSCCSRRWRARTGVPRNPSMKHLTFLTFAFLSVASVAFT